MANKNDKAAERSLRKALEIKPDMLEAQRGLIILAIEEKRFQDATDVARTVQTQRPKASVGFLLEGDIGIAQENWDAASAAYRLGLQRVASTELAVKLHSALMAAGKSPESDRFAETWLKEHPTDAVFPSYLGDMAVSKRDYAAAEKYYLAVLKIRPDSAIALNNLAWVTNQLHKDGALAYAEKANTLVPNQPDFMDTLAMLLAEKNEYAKAIDLQTRAIESEPSNAKMRLNLAKIYIKAGDKSRARTELETLTKLGDKFNAQPEVSALLKSL